MRGVIADSDAVGVDDERDVEPLVWLVGDDAAREAPSPYAPAGAWGASGRVDPQSGRPLRWLAGKL